MFFDSLANRKHTSMKFKTLLSTLVLIVQAVTYTAYGQDSAPAKLFIASPYLQIGREPSANSLSLLWHVADVDADWSVESKNKESDEWKKADAPDFTRLAVAGVDAHRIYHTKITGLTPGGNFKYRVLKNGAEVFIAEAKTPPTDKQNYRFVAIGDIGAQTPNQKLLAVQIYKEKPDLVVVPGDIVYSTGRISEYRNKFWNIYNADQQTIESAPIMRSVPFVASPGNHDIGSRDLDRYPDGLAYFSYWNQPLNGPAGGEGSAISPLLKGSDTNKKAFTDAAGDAFPRMGNFSFNYGNAHWLFLDSNPYVKWDDKDLTDWIKKDLQSAKNTTWRFVVFHHPGFNSSRAHFEDQQMRPLSPLFEAGNVDVVFTGHVHNYQRTFPLTFTPEKAGSAAADKVVRGHVVNGDWKLDKNYNGKTVTKPKGIIYLVTGAGGAGLYDIEQNDDPASWQTFTDKFISNVHSLTVADVDGKTLTIRQVSAAGKEIDSFKVTK
jgi:predicted phosphodiesterase